MEFCTTHLSGEIKMTEKVEDTNVEVNDEVVPSITELQAQIASLQGEVAKERSIRKKALAERDEIKKKVEPNEDFKSLYQQELDARSNLTKALKQRDVTAALTVELAKVGVNPTAVEAALKLANVDIIDWDVDAGVDKTGLSAAVSQLRGSDGFLFEKEVKGTKPTNPKEKSAANGNENEMSREDFDKLTPYEKTAVLRKKVTII
jgi:uncharacterized small protein (DUF1192 family)